MRKIKTEDKPTFVRELGELLKKHSRAGISGMRYEQIGRNEVAVIYYDDGYMRNVDITADSINAMVADIGRALIR